MNKDEFKNIGLKVIYSYFIFKVCIKFIIYLKNNNKDSF